MAWCRGYWDPVEGTKGQAGDLSDGSLLSDERHSKLQWEDYQTACSALCSGGLLECREIHHDKLMIQGNCLNRLLYCFSLRIEMHHLCKRNILTLKAFQGGLQGKQEDKNEKGEWVMVTLWFC